MIRLTYFLLFSLALLISSCSSGDDDPLVVLGVWQISDATIDCPSGNGPSSFSVTTDGCVVIEADQLCIGIAYELDGKGRFIINTNNQKETIEFTYTINGNNVEMCETGSCTNAKLENGNLTLEDTIEGCTIRYVLTQS